MTRLVHIVRRRRGYWSRIADPVVGRLRQYLKTGRIVGLCRRMVRRLVVEILRRRNVITVGGLLGPDGRLRARCCLRQIRKSCN